MQKMFYPKCHGLWGIGLTQQSWQKYRENLERFGFKGSIYLVGREGSELNGRKIYRHTKILTPSPIWPYFSFPLKPSRT